MKNKPAPEPMIGDVLKGRFELLSLIGQGGLSKVFRARDLVAKHAGFKQTEIALKIIIENQDVDADVISLMHREARRLRDLVHPNIVRVYDMDRQGRVHFMVMELLEGNTLAKILSQAPERTLAPDKIKRLVRDVAGALSFSHGQGVVHADLKPGNIFIDRSGQVKLIDFNISAPIARSLRKEEEDTVHILQRFGAVTPAYASPQRLKGAEACEADDVFSFAIVVYLALQGRRPFGKKTSLKAMEEGLEPEIQVIKERAHRHALEKALALDDAHRTASITDFANAFLSESPLDAAARFLKSLRPDRAK